MQEARRKPETLINGHLRHFAFSRVFFSSECESKTTVLSKTELFITLANV